MTFKQGHVTVDWLRVVAPRLYRSRNRAASLFSFVEPVHEMDLPWRADPPVRKAEGSENLLSCHKITFLTQRPRLANVTYRHLYLFLRLRARPAHHLSDSHSVPSGAGLAQPTYRAHTAVQRGPQSLAEYAKMRFCALFHCTWRNEECSRTIT
jgi:hypothetical protein